jgi:hypothetical protein
MCYFVDYNGTFIKFDTDPSSQDSPVWEKVEGTKMKSALDSS